ncbi:hypothetical protein [Xanthomonas sacchari]|uniref:hypothetical protein n=1 Tax=Xanthomonas sacchari TaxID=56458 RepID=UPI0022565FED|nr:hypothetical protein [Xanthomonas sacchari]MCW0387629.1 hypothetical protein [Xanthomonas sacchari]MCW0435311.1 hypothetical protein [Xanthomonas sacchari]MCW0463160.1 hypothetical protein [Xanthomonas sacchari]UYK75777.1 hypothetical protein NG825_14895 [Xanthomonas sacchari]
MSSPRPGSPGATRTCPHCKATILESASVCPACKHHLRFDSAVLQQSAPSALVPLRVEGSIRHPDDGSAWEYTVLVSIRNGRGEEIKRQLVGVGAMLDGEERSFTLSVEATPVRGGKRGKH